MRKAKQKTVILFIQSAESIMIKLVEKGMGRQVAHEVVRECAMESYEGRGFKEILAGHKEIRKYLGEEEIEDALNPKNYIGTAVEQVEKVIRELG